MCMRIRGTVVSLLSCIFIFAHPLYDLRIFSFSFSSPRRNSSPSSPSKQVLLPPPHYGTCLGFYREKTSFSPFFRWSTRIELHHLPAFFVAWTHSTVSTPHCRGESSVDPSVDRKTARSSFRVVSQLLGGKPGPGFFSGYLRKHHAGRGGPLFCRTIARARRAAVPEGRFKVLAFRFLEGLGVR